MCNDDHFRTHVHEERIISSEGPNIPCAAEMSRCDGQPPTSVEKSEVIIISKYLNYT